MMEPAPLTRSPSFDEFPKFITYKDGRVKEARHAVRITAMAMQRILAQAAQEARHEQNAGGVVGSQGKSKKTR